MEGKTPGDERRSNEGSKLERTRGGGEDRVVVGVEAGVEVDVQRRVEVGLRVAAAKHRGGVGRAGWRAGDRRASKVWVRR